MPFAPQISQFSDKTVPFNVAASLCGVAAATAFAHVNGRNPTLKEVHALAEGWSEAGGMNGFQNEVKLLSTMRDRGLVGDFEPTARADAARITADVSAGKPVIVSTGLHYFTLSDVDPATGKFYVGTSGTDLKNGREWMSLDEIERASTDRGHGGINGVVHLTSTPVPRGQQQFLEANAPGESAPAATREPVKVPGTEIGVGDVPTPEQPGAVPSATKPAPVPETEEEKAIKRWLAGNQALDSFSKRLMTQFEEPRLPSYQLPGPPPINLGWRRQYAMPGGG